MSAPAVAPPTAGPYVGPRPLLYGEPFFGREREMQDLLDQLVGDRIVLLHAPSGCGKSSLIEAGLRTLFRQRYFFALPTMRVGRVLQPAKVNPSNPLLASVLHSLEQASPDLDDPLGWPQRSPSLGLHAFLAERRRSAAETAENLYELIVIDQFEEALTPYVAEDVRLEFFRDLALALQPKDRWALLSIREDYLGPLEPYLRYLPTQLCSRFRLAPLSVPNAVRAMREPAGRFGVDFQEAAALQVASYLAETRIPSPKGAQPTVRAGNQVEPVQLQVVCDHIWRHPRKEPNSITCDDLALEGTSENTVEAALRGYYSRRMSEVAGGNQESERAIRDWFETRLITREGFRTQILYTAGGLGTDVLDELVNRYLIRKDVRGEVTWIELAHDRLIQPILQDNRTWFEKHLQPWQLRVRDWERNGRPDLLLLAGADFDSAQEWLNRHSLAELPESDRAFLERSAAEQNRLRKEAMWKRTAFVLRFYGTLGLLALVALAIVVAYSRKTISEAQSVERDARNQAARAKIDAAVAQKQLADAQQESARLSIQQSSLVQDVSEKQTQLASLAVRQKASNAAVRRLQADLRRTEEDLLLQDREVKKLYTAITAENTKNAAARAENQTLQRDNLAARADLQKSRTQLDSERKLLEALRLETPDAVQQASQAIQNLLASADEQTLLPAETLLRAMDGLEQGLARSLQGLTFESKGALQAMDILSDANCLVGIQSGGTVVHWEMDRKGNPCRLGDAGGLLSGWMFLDAAALDPVHKGAILSYANGRFLFYRPDQGKAVENFKLHRHTVTAIALDPQAKLLATGTAFWTMSLWDLDRWTPGSSRPPRLYRVPGVLEYLDRMLGGPNSLVTVLAFSPVETSDSFPEQVLAAGRQDGSIGIFSARKKKLLLQLRTPKELWGSTGGVESAGKTRGHKGGVLSLAFRGDGRLIVSGGQDHTSRIWYLPPWSEIRAKAKDAEYGRLPTAEVVLPGCEGAVAGTAISPDGEVIATGCSDGIVRLYQMRRILPLLKPDPGMKPAAGPEPAEILSGHLGAVTQLRFLRDRRMLATAGGDNHVRLWHIPSLHDMDQRAAIRAEVQQLRAWLAREVESGAPPLIRSLVTGKLNDLPRRASSAAHLWDDNAKWGPLVASPSN